MKEYIFNELSVKDTLLTVHDAQKVLEQFIKVTGRAKSMGFDQIRISESLGKNLFNLKLLENYAVSNWLKDSEVNNDLKDKFRLIFANPPLLKDNEISEIDLFEYSEFFVTLDNQKYRVYGLGVAYIKDTLAVSFQGHQFWNRSNIELLHKHLDNDGNEQIVNREVLHFTNEKHLEEHKLWFEAKQRSLLNQSIELWEKRFEFFPNLILCGEVEKQLRQMGFSKHFDQIIERLRILNDFVSEWKKDEFNYNEVNSTTSLRISPESKQTMTKYGNERKFKLPNGKREYHELHIKTGDLRFHFYPDNDSKKIYVGYIGKHLNTKSG